MLKRPAASQRGFTLLETLVTVGIFALLLAVASPSISAWIMNLRIRNAAETLQNGLQKARTEAIRRNQNVTLWLVSLSDPRTMDNSCALSATSASWVISLDDPAGDCGDAPSDTNAPRIIETYAAGDGSLYVSVDSQTADGNTAADRITFDGFGRVVVTGDPIGRIEVTPPASATDFRPLTIVVSSAGNIRMCDPLVTDADDPRYASNCATP